MLQQKSKRIISYIFLFFLIGTLNNKNFAQSDYLKIKNIYVSGLSKEKNEEVLKKLEILRIQNLFFLEKFQIEKLIDTINYIENYSVFKDYPSSLKIKLIETNYLAYVSKDDKNFYIGSNSKLIKVEDLKKKLPYVFGSLDIDSFFELKIIMDKLNISLDDFEKLFFFPSGRWDLQMNSGILIKLSKDRLEESLKISKEILNNEKFKDIKIIDVRQHNQVIVNEQ